MKARVLALGVLVVVFGTSEYFAITDTLKNIDLGITHSLLVWLVLGGGFILTIAGLLLPIRATKKDITINPNDMKSCPECAALMTPDTFRCPKCGARQRSLYEEIK